MNKKEPASYDVYMARIREAEECNPTNRTAEQKKLLKSFQSSPSYYSLINNRTRTVQRNTTERSTRQKSARSRVKR